MTWAKLIKAKQDPYKIADSIVDSVETALRASVDAYLDYDVSEETKTISFYNDYDFEDGKIDKNEKPYIIKIINEAIKSENCALIGKIYLTSKEIDFSVKYN